MSEKWHISPNTNKAARCVATKRACAFGEENHFGSEAEAFNAIMDRDPQLKALKDEVFTTFSKKSEVAAKLKPVTAGFSFSKIQNHFTNKKIKDLEEKRQRLEVAYETELREHGLSKDRGDRLVADTRPSMNGNQDRRLSRSERTDIKRQSENLGLGPFSDRSIPTWQVDFNEAERVYQKIVKSEPLTPGEELSWKPQMTAFLQAKQAGVKSIADGDNSPENIAINQSVYENDPDLLEDPNKWRLQAYLMGVPANERER